MCKASNISGKNCDRCAKGFEGFPTCSMTGRDLKILVDYNLWSLHNVKFTFFGPLRFSLENRNHKNIEEQVNLRMQDFILVDRNTLIKAA